MASENSPTSNEFYFPNPYSHVHLIQQVSKHIPSHPNSRISYYPSNRKFVSLAKQTYKFIRDKIHQKKMTIENLEDIETTNGGNKWDKIKKKYSSSLNLSSDAVKKFLDMNFVNEKTSKILKGDPKSFSMDNLNPAIIMDLRHEMVRFC